MGGPSRVTPGKARTRQTQGAGRMKIFPTVSGDVGWSGVADRGRKMGRKKGFAQLPISELTGGCVGGAPRGGILRLRGKAGPEDRIADYRRGN